MSKNLQTRGKNKHFLDAGIFQHNVTSITFLSSVCQKLKNTHKRSPKQCYFYPKLYIYIYVCVYVCVCLCVCMLVCAHVQTRSLDLTSEVPQLGSHCILEPFNSYGPKASQNNWKGGHVPPIPHRNEPILL